MKAAPDYWKKEVRQEFNGLLKKFGATSREKRNKNDGDNILTFERDVTVLVSGANSLTLHRNKRAKALLMAVAKWLVTQKAKGREVSVPYWGMQYGTVHGRVPEGDLEKALHLITDLTRVDQTIEWLGSIGERGEKLPLKFDLSFTIELPK